MKMRSKCTRRMKNGKCTNIQLIIRKLFKIELHKKALKMTVSKNIQTRLIPITTDVLKMLIISIPISCYILTDNHSLNVLCILLRLAYEPLFTVGIILLGLNRLTNHSNSEKLLCSL